MKFEQMLNPSACLETWANRFCEFLDTDYGTGSPFGVEGLRAFCFHPGAQVRPIPAADICLTSFNQAVYQQIWHKTCLRVSW